MQPTHERHAAVRQDAADIVYFSGPDRNALPHQPLSRHELAILEALANGAQSKEMAAIIKRSRGTVEFYIRSLFLKLDARSRPHLVAQAFRYGVLSVRSSARGD